VVVDNLGIASFSSTRRVGIVNLVILEQIDEVDRLMCTLAGEFDSTDIGHVEWCRACRAPWARSRVGGGRLLLSIDAMCRLLALCKGRQCCRVAFGASALCDRCHLGIASFSAARRVAIVNLVILEQLDEVD
jgi:hypothetical protein